MLLLLALVSLTLLTAESTSFAETTIAAEKLIAAYKLPSAITTTDANSQIAVLEKALADCNDNYLVFNIRYGIGVIYFKANIMTDAQSIFSQIASDPDCPELIRISSFNMLGQIYRLKGEDTEALEAFNRVAHLAEKWISANTADATDSAALKLLHLALFTRGEIYQLRQNYSAAITEYRRLVDSPGHNKKDKTSQYIIMLAGDRISQLYLREGDIDKYVKCAQLLTAYYPEYYRSPVIKLEIECVKFLKSVAPDFEFQNDSFTAPALLIGYLKDGRNETTAKQLADQLDKLCKEYQKGYGGALLNYHYAWLMETIGEKDKAAKILDRLSSADFTDNNTTSLEKAVIETVQEYAKIQYAIMLTEKADYAKASNVLNSLRTHPPQSHILNIASSIRNSTEILKRETNKNENK